MKRQGKIFIVIMTIFTLIFFPGCKKEEVTPTPKPPSEIPKIPTPPNPPVTMSSVSDIISGTISKGTEVFLYGYLTRMKSGDDDEWFFTDDEGATEIVLDFPTSQIPAINTKFLVYGGVEDAGEVDVISWIATSSKPTNPAPPTFPPSEVTPPALTLTTVAAINQGEKQGEVILAGQITHQQEDDCDEWIFSDGTGSLELEFPSCNVPGIGVPVYVYGKTDGYHEVDVFSWMPQ